MRLVGLRLPGLLLLLMLAEEGQVVQVLVSLVVPVALVRQGPALLEDRLREQDTWGRNIACKVMDDLGREPFHRLRSLLLLSPRGLGSPITGIAATLWGPSRGILNI